MRQMQVMSRRVPLNQQRKEGVRWTVIFELQAWIGIQMCSTYFFCFTEFCNHQTEPNGLMTVHFFPLFIWFLRNNFPWGQIITLATQMKVMSHFVYQHLSTQYWVCLRVIMCPLLMWFSDYTSISDIVASQKKIMSAIKTPTFKSWSTKDPKKVWFYQSIKCVKFFSSSGPDTGMGPKKWCQLEQSGSGLVLLDQFRLNTSPFLLSTSTHEIYQKNFKSGEF